ncbi:ATP-dependent protease subunit HslV [Candidatus Nardonella dryophthoridicola]|uniref:ATP-dependent protease subunit HslV n=1 Tax=endosymbiont of Rhynchophorus ferrugineus TaxID=1972133 RepID=A0A2Z5T8W2_9GAMM|nr:ATP-dependent protease subunit HslV [Candidatus Nardonella dryophthoridicola]QTJ62793.1 ATP-dependent protease subunit HslV [Candidatus Nardonella dryophthoridicola]BBA85036.1 ATP-dependent protease subunit HslV [endosymbiont of Rhynchophorus ferrugineus]
MTTILSIRDNKSVVIGGDGQATLGNNIIKDNVIKIKKIYNNKILSGFSGSTSDSFTLLEILEKKIDFYQGNLLKSALELSKDWRTDKFLRRLETMLIVVNKNISLLITGNGDVMQFDDNIIAIGSGGMYARSSAKALVENTKLPIKDIVNKSLKIASEICIYTNNNFIIEELIY